MSIHDTVACPLELLVETSSIPPLPPESIPQFLFDLVFQAFWCQHPHIRHPGHNPAGEFLPACDLYAHFRPAIRPPGELLRGVPVPLHEVHRQFRFEK
jgi:hypothetical protein